MPLVPRVVVLDAAHDVAHIVRGALTLLNRDYILVEVPSTEAVLDEVAQASIALVVTAYTVPGEMNGVELAKRINHESLETPVIVLAEAGDPAPDDPDIAGAPFQYFMRPVAEPFLRGLRIALDGETAVIDEPHEDELETDLGPVPPVDIDELRTILVQLMRDVGAMGVILSDRTGRVLVDEGATGYVDREKLAALLGPSFARSADISPLVGGNAWTMQYYDGERLDIFGLALGMHYFMGLIFEGTNRGAFGAVTMFGRRAADQMIKMIGDAAYGVKPSEAPPKKPVSKAPKKAETVPAEVVEEPAAEAPEPEPIAGFDPDSLFGQSVDESMADTMFDPDDLEDIAASIEDEGDERVGYDEAIDMGILDE